MDFSFELATQTDDPDIRRLLASSAMPGRITVTFEREPNYFLGCSTMGQFCQVIIIRHIPSREIAGMLVRASRRYFINGEPQELGYLGQIRIAEKYRGQKLLSRCLPFFQQLHADGRVPVYFGVISNENKTARDILVEKHLENFPSAYEVTTLCTLGIILRKAKTPLPSLYPIQRGTLIEIPEIVTFLQKHGAETQFYPVYSEQDFSGSNKSTTRDFDVRDFCVARDDNQNIVGVMGLWDQAKYKQTIVQAYGGALKWGRFGYNPVAKLLGAQPLPAPGGHLHSAYVSFICISGTNSRFIFSVLLRHIYDLASERGYAHLMLGLAEDDPLLSIAKEYAHILYQSKLYVGYWEDGKGFYEQLDERIPYIEIAAL